MRAKLVAESLDQLYEDKKKEMANVNKTKENFEKSGAKKLAGDKKDKINQAIKALVSQLVKVKKSNDFKTVTQKNAKIKELEDKITVWKKKLE